MKEEQYERAIQIHYRIDALEKIKADLSRVDNKLTEIHLITGEIGICSLLTGQNGHYEIPRISYQTSKGNVVLFPDEVLPIDMAFLQQQINDGYVMLSDGRYLPPKETVECCYNASGARVGLMDNWERTYDEWLK